MGKKVIGIDLGTSNSCVAVVENGVPTIIVNSEGNRTTPSIVGFDKDERKVGEPAKRQAITNPQKTVHSIKRFIGKKFNDTKEFANKFSYKVVNGTNELAVVSIDNKNYTPQEISAAVLQKMKKTAEDYLGEEVTDAVITVPAYFGDAERTATKEAGEIAGLNVKRIINEPTAAALAFGIDKLNKDMKVLVFDFGGGTFDVSILELGDGVFEVKSTNGDVFLGGNDIDNLIIDWLVEKGKQEFGTDLSKDPMALQRLKETAEKAKIELSNTNSTEINLPYITVVDNVPKHLTCSLNKATYENMITPIVDKCINIAKEALKKADMTPSDIDEVLLVGGSTRIPLVQERVKELFGKEGNKSVNPDEAVALGAAIQGSILAGEQTGIVLLDVTPLNLNITTMGNIATCMIEANTTIPTSKSQVFSTAQDNQPAVDIEITQGNRSMAADNKRLGLFVLDGIAPARRGVPQIEVTFSLDSNGILDVKAVDKATGKSQDIRIEGSSGLSKEEVEKMKADAEAHAEDDKKKAEHLTEINAIENSIYQSEHNLEEVKDKITEEDKKAIEEATSNLKSVFEVKDEDRDMEVIRNAAKALTEAWYKASEYMAKQSQDSSINNTDDQTQ